MDLFRARVEQVLDAAATPEPAPGTGALAAISLALAAAAVTGAARAAKASWPEARAAAAQAHALRARAERLAADHTVVYPKARGLLDAGEPGRGAALETALVLAAAVPLAAAESAADVALLAADVAEWGEPSSRDDVIAAAFLAAATARAAAHLVAINLTARPGDDRVARADSLAVAAAEAAERAAATAR